MKVTNWKAYQKGTLQGFFELALDSGLNIRGMTYHSQDGKRWVSFPSKPYESDGETKYQSILHIPGDGRWKKFQSLALAALDSYFAQHEGDHPGDVPF